jgi:predicted secreted hydrolase
MDREFGSSFIEDGQVGWDWFAIQLDDGRDLMLYQLRRNDGRASADLVHAMGP